MACFADEYKDPATNVIYTYYPATGRAEVKEGYDFPSGKFARKISIRAKGGVVVGVSDRFGIPVRYIGVGEKIEDIRPFDKESFVGTLFKPEDI